MIKQIKSSDIKKFIHDNPNTVLLDVRTEDEWNTVGKPETKDLGIKSLRPGELSLEQIPEDAKFKAFTVWLN